MDIIEWCNTNNGFLTGVLSLLTLIVSIIAVVISVRTARMPYKKKLKITSGINVIATKLATGQVFTEFKGIAVNAANVGNRNVNISFLGFAVRVPGKEIQTMQSVERDLGGKGILAPTEVVTVEYTAKEIQVFGSLPPKAKVYSCAMDSEGKMYLKYYGRAGKMSETLQRIH